MSVFCAITLTGKDAQKFLQGQLTINTAKLTDTPTACAICNLKGRVQFGLWVSQLSPDSFWLIIWAECVDELVAHIKKYGAFSKFELSTPSPVFATLTDGVPTFSPNNDSTPFDKWALASLAVGNYWITPPTQNAFQPQELRLHQRGGVDYDKGCYLGQEIVARLYFKASPKAYLHRVRLNAPAQAGDKIGKVSVLNAIGQDALVVGTPDEVVQIGQVLAFGDDTLNQSVARG
ncbi:MAG: folate-binding Fe/S cluster repair protein [Moraxella sp.]|nr:folate-binding Fe/S cluster repair protein [Moraxella sp.]